MSFPNCGKESGVNCPHGSLEPGLLERGGPSGRGGAAPGAGDARSPGSVLAVPRGCSCLSPVQAGQIAGWAGHCIPLPFGKLKGERQRVLLWVLIYIDNLLTFSVAANRIFFGLFSPRVFAPMLLSRGMMQDYMELIDTY